MIRLWSISFILVLIFVRPAFAEDARLLEIEYDQNKIVSIESRALVQTTISFSEDEVIENVAIGDSQSWQVTPNKRADLLFLKPLADDAKTNLTVVTSKRTYLFDLSASPRNQPIYLLSFVYPELEAARQAELRQIQQANASEMAAANDPFAVIDPEQLNFSWQKRGDQSLYPVRVFDDGRVTFLNWPPDRTIPAILVKDLDGTEGPVNFTVRGQTIVVQGVPRELVLRYGSETAELVNTGPLRISRPLDDSAVLAEIEAQHQEIDE